MDTQIELACDVCGEKFLRRKAEVNRSKKLGRRNYCSLKCVGKDNNEHLDEFKGIISDNFGRKTDDLSPFRYHLNRLRSHYDKRKKSNREIFVTLEDLKNQWDKQNGICPYTGWKLKTSKNTSEYLGFTPDRASLDRIDSSKPYTKDNIQFVSLMAQFAKNKWQEQELLEFCEAVVKNKTK
jgi:hypothetical protein